MLTAQQTNIINTVIATYGAVEGTQCSTMLAGIVDAYCSSGILTDALSANDLERLSAYFTEDGIYSAGIDTLNTYMEEVEGESLQCIKAIALLQTACDSNYDFETIVLKMNAMHTQEA
jgi:hypothetical protein